MQDVLALPHKHPQCVLPKSCNTVYSASSTVSIMSQTESTNQSSSMLCAAGAHSMLEVSLTQANSDQRGMRATHTPRYWFGRYTSTEMGDALQGTEVMALEVGRHEHWSAQDNQINCHRTTCMQCTVPISPAQAAEMP